jgi:hypothetical protein
LGDTIPAAQAVHEPWSAPAGRPAAKLLTWAELATAPDSTFPSGALPVLSDQTPIWVVYDSRLSDPTPPTGQSNLVVLNARTGAFIIAQMARATSLRFVNTLPDHQHPSGPPLCLNQ